MIWRLTQKIYERLLEGSFGHVCVGIYSRIPLYTKARRNIGFVPDPSNREHYNYEMVNKMRILITGNRGFVGSATQEYLEAMGHTVIGYDLIDGYDIRDHCQLYERAKEYEVDRILHLAAIARFAEADKDRHTAWSTNATGTRTVVDVANALHIPLVYSSTGSVYMPIHQEPPITEEFTVSGNSNYGCSKLRGEDAITKFCEGHWIILRYAHLYGKEKRYHGLIGGFLSRIERGLAPTLYGGKQSNDFTYIKDVARANYLALIAPSDKWRQTYNIGSGEELSAEDAGRIVCECSGYRGDVEIKDQRTVDAQRFVYDTKKAEEYLGFKAEYDFATGIKDMLK